MTSALRRSFAEAEKLPNEDQDAIASRLLAEVEDEQKWSTRFAATTDDQWDRIVAEVRRDAATRGARPLDEALLAVQASEQAAGDLLGPRRAGVPGFRTSGRRCHHLVLDRLACRI